MENKVIDYDIQPKASILNVFSRLSYKAWYAIAEFVDNSTQSYLSHKNILDNSDGFNGLYINIKYDENENTLRIEDNAFGMEIERFLDAITLDAKNSAQEGRNEFGMGLKTAASWFGEKWSVKSTQYGSLKSYYACIDIPKLKDEDLNTTPIYTFDADEKSHGTVILIEKLTKKLSASRTIGKIRKILASMYRRDISLNDIKIIFNGEEIEYGEIEVLKFRDKIWKKDLDFEFEFDEKMYRVSGFVGIMNKGSFSSAGFALFRRNRVIIGGEDNNYKPLEIFSQLQSQISLKLFGELDMDDFPVNQAKDGFIWDDGLEEAFINALKIHIGDYIEIAKLSKKDRAKEEQNSEETSKNVQKEVSKAIDAFKRQMSDVGQNPKDELVEQNELSDLEVYQKALEEENNNLLEEKLVGEEREYIIPINYVITKKVTVRWEIASQKKWITKTENEEELNVIININHPFFKPYSENVDFKIVLEKFVIALVISEEQAKIIADKEGLIPASAIRTAMNDLLSKLQE